MGDLFQDPGNVAGNRITEKQIISLFFKTTILAVPAPTSIPATSMAYFLPPGSGRPDNLGKGFPNRVRSCPSL